MELVRVRFQRGVGSGVPSGHPGSGTSPPVSPLCKMARTGVPSRGFVRVKGASALEDLTVAPGPQQNTTRGSISRPRLSASSAVNACAVSRLLFCLFFFLSAVGFSVNIKKVSMFHTVYVQRKQQQAV